MPSKEKRLLKAREFMAQKALDGLLILSGENRRYLSGYTAEDHQFEETAGALLITHDQQVLITDSRFELQAQNEAPQWSINIYRQAMAKDIAALIRSSGVSHLGFESQRMSFHQHAELTSELNQIGDSIKMIPVSDLGAVLRQIKEAEEIKYTYQALRLAENAFRQVARALEPGMSEKAVAWELEKKLREAGADDLSFPAIVAFGPNSALPHAVPGDRTLKVGEPILIDWGCRLNGYCSDTTRTLILGSPDDMFLKVYHCVLEAQQRAIALIKAGANTKTVDAAARDHIHNNGFQGKFGHGLGHGTGLAIHEAPRLSPIKESILESGMIVTVEPGIYLPQWGGVRIEHQVVVRPNGAEIMNTLTTSYRIEDL